MGPPDAAGPGDPSPRATDQSAHLDVTTTSPPEGSAPGQDTTGQLSLDDLPAVARVTDPGTSWAAARDPQGHRRRIIDTYVVTFAQSRRALATYDLCQRHGGESAHVARRITDMVRLGWVRHESERRSPRTGRWQRTYAITDSGLRYAATVLARRVAS